MLEEAVVLGDDVLGGEGLRIDQSRRGHNQADRLEVAEPFNVRQQFRVSGHDFHLTPTTARDRPGRRARSAGP